MHRHLDGSMQIGEAMKKESGGYSLVEVLIAIAITGVVLLTVVTLFYMGRRNVYSGKQMTYAVSVGTRVMEDLSTMTSGDVFTAFGIVDPGTTPANATPTTQQEVVICDNRLLALGTTTCTSSKVSFLDSTSRDTDTVNAGTDPGGYLAKWSALVDPTKLTNGKVF